MLSRNDKPPDIWDTHGMSGNVFVNPPASSSPFPGGFNPWISNVTEDTSPHVTSERQNPYTTLDLRCQSGTSSFDPSEGDSLRIVEQTNNDCRFRSSFRQIPYTSNVCLLEDKIQDWGSYLFTISFGSYALDQRSGVDSVDDLMSSSSFRGIQMPNSELLDARIASALNRIIHNSHLRRRISLEEQKAQKQDRFLRGRQIPYLIYEYFRVTGANDSVENDADLFTVGSWKWRYSGIRFKMGRNSVVDDTNPIWWHLGKLVQIENARVWQTQDRVGIVQYGDSSEEGWTWSSQIEDNGKKKYLAEFENEEFWGQKRKFWNKRRGQESLDETAWTKKSRRLLAMESWRAVSKRRQLQFPTRFE